MDTALPQLIWGKTPEEWSALVENARTFLIGVASQRRTTTYQSVAQALGIGHHRGPIATVLEHVAQREQSEGRPPLTSLVLYTDRPKPGVGFFKWAIANALLAEDADDETRYVFWLKSVHACWVRWS